MTNTIPPYILKLAERVPALLEIWTAWAADRMDEFRRLQNEYPDADWVGMMYWISATGATDLVDLANGLLGEISRGTMTVAEARRQWGDFTRVEDEDDTETASYIGNPDERES
jgi:hypothetical protein